jgi:hypothetical protein
VLALDGQNTFVISPLQLAGLHGLDYYHMKMADLGPWTDICVLHEQLEES